MLETESEELVVYEMPKREETETEGETLTGEDTETEEEETEWETETSGGVERGTHGNRNGGETEEEAAKDENGRDGNLVGEKAEKTIGVGEDGDTDSREERESSDGTDTIYDGGADEGSRHGLGDDEGGSREDPDDEGEARPNTEVCRDDSAGGFGCLRRWGGGMDIFATAGPSLTENLPRLRPWYVLRSGAQWGTCKGCRTPDPQCG
jgi:hypothetical protein